MVSGKRHGCLLFTAVEMAISHRHPCQPGLSLQGCSGACCVQNALQHPLFCMGDVQLWKKFGVVKVLKNILWLIDTYVFLSRVGKDTSGWFYLEPNGILYFLPMSSFPCWVVSLCSSAGCAVPQGIWAWFCNSSTWGTASNFSEISGHGTVTLSVLEKTYRDQGLCLLALIIPTVAFI